MSLNSKKVIYYILIVIANILFITTESFGQNPSASSKDVNIEDSIKKHYRHYWADYPQKAKEEGVSGTVILTFDVDSTCSIINRKVKEGIGYGCDESALSSLDKMEKDLKNDNKSKCKPSSITMPVKFIQK